MPRDGYVTLAALLTPEEAGMAHGLLESAGVEALLEDQALSAVDPLVRFAIGGTKLLVREEDAARARALLDEYGAMSPTRARPGGEVEIPEEEWSALPPAPPAEAREDRPWLGRAMALIVIVVAATVAVLGESHRLRWPPWGR